MVFPELKRRSSAPCSRWRAGFWAALLLLTSAPAVFSSGSTAETGGHDNLFDLEQEVLQIPGTHEDPSPYRFGVTRNPADLEWDLDWTGGEAEGSLTMRLRIAETNGWDPRSGAVHVTNRSLNFYERLRLAPREPGVWDCTFGPPRKGRYRFEVLFNTPKGWLNLRRDLKLPRASVEREDTAMRDRGYSVRVRPMPAKLYEGHISTLVYTFLYEGEPIPVEKIDGADLVAAIWNASMFSHMKEFQVVRPRQNLGGPDVAVSFVFEKGGKHRIFADFKHNGVVRTVDSEVTVHVEANH